MAETNLITTIDEFTTEYEKTIGDILTWHPSKEANLDNIRRFGDGVGDYNPLWRNPEHAAASCYGMITAPPPFFYAVSLGKASGSDLWLSIPGWSPSRINVKKL